MEKTKIVDDIFNNLIGGDNPMKFMNLLQTVGKKIQDKVTSGGLNQEKLVEEAQSMMSSLGGNNPLFDQLMKNNSPTHQRLRKKLEKRQNKN